MDKEIVIEIVKIIPSVLWVFLVAFLVFLFRKVINNDLLSRLTNFKALGVEASFIKQELDHVASSSRNEVAGTDESRSQVARRAGRIKNILSGTRILLVNDVPAEMNAVVSILEELKIRVSIATSTNEAIDRLKNNRFDLVVSDMRRGDEIDAGARLLSETRKLGIDKPTIFIVGNYKPDRGVPAYAFGITNRVDELLNLIFDAIERSKG